MGRDDRQRRRSGGRTTRNALLRRRVWRAWYHGRSEARAWADAARCFEGLEDWPADPVMAAVPAGGQTAPRGRRAKGAGR